MKAAKTLLAGTFLSCATVSYAQNLEEAIKGIDVGGFLRYRYTDTRMENYNFTKGNNGTGGGSARSFGGGAEHNWRTNVDLTTPEIKGMKANLGLVYSNSNYTNTGSGSDRGLGAGYDGSFGVSTFYLEGTLPGTQSFIRAGKQRIDLPVHDTTDDRATGVWLQSNDLAGVKLHAAFIDTFSLDDGAIGVPFANGANSISKPYYSLGTVLDMQGFNAQFLYLGIQDFINHTFYLSAGYKHPNFHVKGEYAFSQLQGKGFESFTPNIVLQENHALYTIDAGVRYSIAALRGGYIGSGSDGYQVSLDNQGAFSMAGQAWNDDSITGITYSPFGAFPIDKKSLSVFYGSLSLYFLDNDAIQVSLDYIQGKHKNETTATTLDFTEITPYVGYQYTDNLRFYIYYAMLSAKQKPAQPIGENTTSATYADAKQNRVRFEALYRF